MNTINFSCNWNNKLGCNIFTTFRLQNTKYRVGSHHKIHLKGKEKGVAEVVSINDMPLRMVTEGIALIDTGYNLDEFKKIVRKMYKNADRELYSLIFMRWVSKA